MHYKELIGILKETYEIKIMSSSDSPVVMDIRLLSRDESHWDEHVLYLGSLSHLKVKPDRPVMLLCTDDSLTLPEGSNYCRIRNEDLFDLFNTAKDLIFEDLRSGGVVFELAQMVIGGKSISYVINTAAKLLGNAIILVDLSQKVLAHSTNYEIVDPLWAQNVERGYCSYEFVQKVRSDRSMKEWSKYGSETQLITLSGDMQPKLVARITQEGHVVGAVIMIEHHTPIGRSHLRQLPVVGRLLFDAFNRDSISGGLQRPFYSAVLYNLLDENEIANNIEDIAVSKIDFPKQMYVVVARFVHHMENRYIKRTFSMELEHIFPRGYSVNYKSYIGILVPSVSEKQREELVSLAQNENVSIGISWPFKDIVEFKKHFNQAAASIKQAQRFGRINDVFEYSNFYYYDLLYNYTGKTPLEYYCHPALNVLREYDKANNTELYNTLRIYLECEKNLRASAEKLFIHRNTLIYRVNRINELTGLNLDDVNIVYCLMDSFRIETFLNK